MTMNGEIILILRYFTEFSSFLGALRIKVVDQAIAMDNLRLLCLVVSLSADGPRDAHGINS